MSSPASAARSGSATSGREIDGQGGPPGPSGHASVGSSGLKSRRYPASSRGLGTWEEGSAPSRPVQRRAGPEAREGPTADAPIQNISGLPQGLAGFAVAG